jgi:hypothetical protein
MTINEQIVVKRGLTRPECLLRSVGGVIELDGRKRLNKDAKSCEEGHMANGKLSNGDHF